MSQLQRSKYNYFVDRIDGAVVGYNARTGTFALLANDVALLLRSKTEPLRNLRDTDDLVAMGFLHHGDEFEHVVARYNQQRDLRHLLHLTPIPTLACNLACDYCFQNEYRHDRIMSEKTQAASLRYVAARVAQGRTEVLCSWFGGEPLLCKDIVVNMSRKLRHIVDDAGGHLRMSIITNGTLLDGPTAKALADVGVQDAQVSFDSLTYNGFNKRGVLDPDGCPSLILKNVITARKNMAVSIRINVSRTDAEEVPQILKVLDGHGLMEDVTLARVHDFEGDTNYITDQQGERKAFSECGSCTSSCGHGNSLGRPEYSHFEREVFLSRPEGLDGMVRKLKPKSHFCSATSGHMFVIDPAGYVSRCWHSAGSPSEAMGNVHDSEESFDHSAIAQRWQNYRPFTYPSCSNCKVLPLCMGGCSHSRVFMNASRSPCESIKQQIQYCVEQVAAHIKIDVEQHELVA